MRSGIVLLAAWLLAPAPEAWAGQAGPEAEPITLARVLAAGRAESPAIAAARSREDAAAAAAGAAGRWPNPAIELRSENWGAGVPGGLRKDSFATLTQTLELGGKRGARRATALAAAEAARAGTLAALRATERGHRRALSGGRPPAGSDGHPGRPARRPRRTGPHPRTPGGRRSGARRRTRPPRGGTDHRRHRGDPSRSGGRPGFFGTPGARRPSGRDNGGRPSFGPSRSRCPREIRRRSPAAPRPRAPMSRTATARVETAQRALRLENSLRIPDLTVNTGLKRTLETNTGVFALGVSLPLFDRRQVGHHPGARRGPGRRTRAGCGHPACRRGRHRRAPDRAPAGRGCRRHGLATG